MAKEDSEESARQTPPSSQAAGPRQWFMSAGALFVLFTVSQALAPHLSAGIGKLLAPDPHMAGEESAEAGGEQSMPEGPPIYLPLDPPLIVNFEEDNVVRFLQVRVEIMARDQQVIDDLETHTPVIRNNLLLLYSSQDYHHITSREGKEELRAQTLEEIHAIMRRETGGSKVEDVFFTSFVVQ